MKLRRLLCAVNSQSRALELNVVVMGKIPQRFGNGSFGPVLAWRFIDSEIVFHACCDMRRCEPAAMYEMKLADACMYCVCVCVWTYSCVHACVFISQKRTEAVEDRASKYTIIWLPHMRPIVVYTQTTNEMRPFYSGNEHNLGSSGWNDADCVESNRCWSGGVKRLYPDRVAYREWVKWIINSCNAP